MENNQDRFQEKLAALENGKPLADCQERLNDSEAELLQFAAMLRAFQPPDRKTNVFMAQLAHITKVAEDQRAEMPAVSPRPAEPPPAVRSTRPTLPGMKAAGTRPTWFWPMVTSGGVILLLFACMALLGLGIGAGRLVSGIFDLKPGQASISELHGLVERQEKDGTWTAVGRKDDFTPGTHLRTGALSSVLLTLADGSQLRLGSETEVVLDQMDRSLRGTRVIRVTQWQGMTQHQVKSSKRPDSLYEIRTPAGTSTARGTEFTVQLQAAGQQTRINVTEGAVDVTGMGKTVTVPAGNMTTVAAAQPPADPALLVNGEGVLALGEDILTVAGQAVILGPTVANAEMLNDGDLVTFEGQQLPDGTIQVDHIEALRSHESNIFRMTASVEALADTALLATDTVILMNEQTLFSGNVTLGEMATIEGIVQADGSWLATQVYGASDGQPFQFTGVVEKTGSEQWVISGLPIEIDQNTQIAQDFIVGEIVEVQGWIQNGDWQASSIQPAPHTETYFDITGKVKNTNPWVINGITLETRVWTRIDAEVQAGDQARVRGAILADGTWVAASIDKVVQEPDEQVTLNFIGTVNSTEPWVVSGISLVVDASTVIDGELVTGTLVEVHATRQPDGAWHTDQITAILPPSHGCVTYASVVTAMDKGILTLQDGSSIDLSSVEQVEGDIQVESVVLVVKCMAANGSVTYPLIKVIETPAGTPTPTPTLTPTATRTPLPASIILPNCYKITFLGMIENGDGTSSWRYEVEELSCAQDLSNWVLELPDCAQIVDAAPSPWEAVNPDPNHQLNGIKWQTGAGFDRGEFTVTLSGKLTTGMTRVGAKGPDVAIGSLAGPVCDLGTITPSPTPTITLTPTITSTPTVTLTPTATVEATLPPTLIPTNPPQSGIACPAVITDNDQYVVINCSGGTVTVLGNNNTVIVNGSCSNLTVRGNNNRITVPGGTPINNSGNENVINQH